MILGHSRIKWHHTKGKCVSGLLSTTHLHCKVDLSTSGQWNKRLFLHDRAAAATYRHILKINCSGSVKEVWQKITIQIHDNKMVTMTLQHELYHCQLPWYAAHFQHDPLDVSKNQIQKLWRVLRAGWTLKQIVINPLEDYENQIKILGHYQLYFTGNCITMHCILLWLDTYDRIQPCWNKMDAITCLCFVVL